MFMSGGSDPHISIPLGITVGLLASFVQSLGLTIQRKSHVQNQALPESEQKVEHRRPLWLLGFGIFISSNLFGSVFQIASLPVVILAPLGAVSLLWNAFFARLILGDVFSPWMVISTLCIAGGAVLIAVFGIVPEPTHSLEDLLALFSRPAFIAYFSLLGLFTLVSLIITHAVEYYSSGRIALPDDTPPLSPLLVPHSDPTILTAATMPNMTAEHHNDHTTERSPLIDPKTSRASSLSPPSSLSSCLTSSNTPLFLAMSYASFGGIISGMCLLIAKSGVELLVLTIAGNNQFWRWQAWMLVLGLGVCALLQLWYMHKSLVLADPTLVCPLAFCLYNLSSIINGLVYFDQFSSLSTSHLLLVILGMVILLAGVWIVSFPPSGNHRIDLSTWDESADQSALEDEIHDSYEDEPLPMAGSPHPRDEEIGLGRVSASSEMPPPHSPLLIDLTPESSQEDRHTAQIECAVDENGPSPTSTRSGRQSRRQTDSALLSSHYGTPPTFARTPAPYPPPQQPNSPTRFRHRLSHVSTHSHHSTLGPLSPRQGFPHHPLTPSAPGGFSIGLSPVSPGFSLVPTERGGRRRRVSLDGVGDPFVGQHGKAGNRVISGGSRSSVARSDEGERSGDIEEQHPASDGSAPPQSGDAPATARGRWRWLAGISAFNSR